MLSFDNFLVTTWGQEVKSQREKTKQIPRPSNVKTLRQIAPNFCGLLRKAELLIPNLKFKPWMDSWVELRRTEAKVVISIGLIICGGG